MALNVGINGFGRIGRIIFRTFFQNPSIKVSAINDPAVDIDYMCYLIKFDSTHGKFRGSVERSDNEIIIDGHRIAIFREKLPTNIPWQVAGVQYVVEASGMFTNMEKASGHLTSEGVKRVLVTAPSLDVPMVVLGVNDDTLSAGHKVISCASSTLYCLAPIIKVLEDNFGVSHGFITSIHAMTPSLKPLDGLCLKGKHWRDHRSIHQNIIPATTGACRALGKIIPQVKDKMTGLAFRVPIVNVSVLDITVRLKSSTSMEGIIRQIENARNYNMQNIIKVSKEQAVSSDFIGDTFSCILDLNASLQLTPDFFKLICWYENEYSYACRIMDSIFFLERQYQLEWKLNTSYIRPTPKQSLVQQRECQNGVTYHQACSYEYHSNPKSLCSTSQDSGLKSPKRPLPRKIMSPRNNRTRQLLFNKETKNKNEIFKIWNDVDETVKPPHRQNRSSLFHSCVAITPQFKTDTYLKTQERLENVKREFSKMVIMTENLLKQSQHSKIEIGLTKEQSNNIGDTNAEKCRDEIHNPINNCNHYIAIKAHDNNSKDIKVKNDPMNVNSNKKDNQNTGTINEKMSNNINNNEISSSSLSNENCTYSLIQMKLNNRDLIPTSTNVEGSNDKKYSVDNNCKRNLGVSNNLICNLKKFKITIADNCTSKEENICEYVDLPHGETDNQKETTYTENDKCSRHKVTKQSESCTALVACASNKNTTETVDTNKLGKKNEESRDKQGRNLQLRLEGALKKLSIDSSVVSEKPSACLSSIYTITTASNRDIKLKQDIYDKLDSVSATDSENSFHMKERKSQVLNITDLTNSLEDLESLDKICRIIEISDELSDKLLSALNSNERKELENKKWSFKDLCEKIKLDDFCNKIFSKNYV